MDKRYTVMKGIFEIKRSAYRVLATTILPGSPVIVAVPYGTYIPVLEKLYMPSDVMIIDEFGGIYSGIPIEWDFTYYNREKAGFSYISGTFPMPDGVRGDTPDWNVIKAEVQVLEPSASVQYCGMFFAGVEINECIPPFPGFAKVMYVEDSIPFAGCIRSGQPLSGFDIKQPI